MKRRWIIFSFVVSAIILLLLPTPVQAITISSDVTFQAGDDMTVYWNAANTLSSIIVKNGSISFNGYELGASDSVNITMLAWPTAASGESRGEFLFLANSTPSTSVNFSFVIAGTIGSWIVNVDGERLDSGSDTILFTISEWQSGVNRTVFLIVNFIGARVGWLIQYGPTWVTLLVGTGIIGLIFYSFWTGIKKQKKTGKIWKFMPRKFR